MSLQKARNTRLKCSLFYTFLFWIMGVGFIICGVLFVHTDIGGFNSFFVSVAVCAVLGFYKGFEGYTKDLEYWDPDNVNRRAQIEENKRLRETQVRQEQDRESARILTQKYKELITKVYCLPGQDKYYITSISIALDKCSNYSEVRLWERDYYWVLQNAVYAEEVRLEEVEKAKRAKNFYSSPEWNKLKRKALHIWGNDVCCCCSESLIGKVKHVDHIKPRSKYPNLALKLSNLQVMCDLCNVTKGNRYETDFRTDAQRRRLID